MNLKHLLTAALLLTASLRADLPITREEAAGLKSMDLSQIIKEGPDLEGKMVRLKFNYRSATVEKADDGSIKGMLSIWKSSTGAAGSTYKYGHINVTVPPEGAEWFMKISTAESRATLNVIAKLVKAKVPGPALLDAQILGREIKTDTKGPRITW